MNLDNAKTNHAWKYYKNRISNQNANDFVIYL